MGSPLRRGLHERQLAERDAAVAVGQRVSIDDVVHRYELLRMSNPSDVAGAEGPEHEIVV